MGFEDQIATFFQGYAYQPMWVYVGVVVFMFLSSFGLPLPEEVTLVSAGLVAYMAMHPDKYPPPDEGTPVNVYVLAVVCFIAVIASDYLIYWIGKYFGRPLLKKPRFKKYFPPSVVTRIENWVQAYGAWAAGLFRFTPGLRFPGHMMCGMMSLPTWKFLAVDGTAALLTVPTQIILVAFYGEFILTYFGKFKFVIGGVLLAILIFVVVRKFILWRTRPT